MGLYDKSERLLTALQETGEEVGVRETALCSTLGETSL